MLNEESMTRYDETYMSWKSWGAGFGDVSPADDAYFSGELNRIGFTPEKITKTLEIGFGNGSFISWLNNKGSVCEGVEVNVKLVEHARSRGFVVFNGLGEIPAESKYELIVAFDVLEHIPNNDLVGFITAISLHLQNDGVLLFRFPNGDSPFGRMYQNGDITHCTSIGTHKIRQIAGLCGLDLCQTNAPYLPTGAGFIEVNKRKVLRHIRSLIQTLISRVYFDGQAIECHPNLIAVLKKLA